MLRKFGLIGKNIEYSFSRTYFSDKFKNEKISDATYVNFDIQNIEEFKDILKEKPELKGLNVTIPYKEQIIPYLDKISKKAKKIGAVNTIKFSKKGKLIGYNTDYYGFKNALKPFLKTHHKKALILGTGGASKAIAFVLKDLDIEFAFVSRTKAIDNYTYQELNNSVINNYQIIINCTPIGTYPDINECPNIPYKAINNQHLLFDLIYNPKESKFLKNGKTQGATICNGLKMLELQAEKAWSIWN